MALAGQSAINLASNSASLQQIADAPKQLWHQCAAGYLDEDEQRL